MAIARARSTASAAMLIAARDDLRGVRLSGGEAAWLCAVRILEADDRRGEESGFVVQGSGARWSNLEALLDLSIYGNLAHRQLAHRGGFGHGCELCEQGHALWHNTVIQPLLLRRQRTASSLFQAAKTRAMTDIDAFG